MLITELAESGVGDQTIVDVAGHVSRQMLKDYSYIRMRSPPWIPQQRFTVPKAAVLPVRRPGKTKRVLTVYRRQRTSEKNVFA